MLLHPYEYNVLKLFYPNNTYYVADVASKLNISKANARRYLYSLEKSGYLHKGVEVIDGGRRPSTNFGVIRLMFSLTDRGKAYVATPSFRLVWLHKRRGAPRKTNPLTEDLCIGITKEDKQRLQTYCKQHDITAARFVRELILDFLNKQGEN